MLRSILVAAALAAAGPAFAHQVSCEKQLAILQTDPEGMLVLDASGHPSFEAAPATFLRLDRYPTQVAFRIAVQNIALDPSVVKAIEDPFLATAVAAGGAILGDIPLGTPIPPGETRELFVVVPIADRDACLALGGAAEPAASPAQACAPGTLDNVFTALTETTVAQCRARLVCGDPDAPPGLE